MFRQFRTKIFVLLFAILIILLFIVYGLVKNGVSVLLVALIPALTALVWNLFHLVDKTNTEIATFLANIKYNDYAVNFSETKAQDESYQKLHGAFNLVTKKFRDIRSEKEAQFQYLQTIVENVDTGLISFDASGKTVLMNRGLRQLLHKSYFPTLNSVKLYNENLHEALTEIQPGEKQLVKFIINGQVVQLSIRKTILRMQDDAFHLYAISNIHAELEEQEVQSWQKLIRILTHEIMNSIAPVVSLSATTQQLIEDDGLTDEDKKSDVKKAVSAINRRSSGLMKFTETYRQLTKIPIPKLLAVDPAELMEQVLTLLSNDLAHGKVHVVRQYPQQPIATKLDPDLMEQVFINLVLNAIQALKDVAEPQLSLLISNGTEGNLEVQIQDNGPGIPEDVLSQIFIPFYTTREKGSGIGLSLSRQIINLHKGQIYVRSEEGLGTTFTIKL
ncbi:MAG: ATP-binding protein [Saprospiraceae bacterium]|nr:ATP-binding protein [Saprospiraceae bacterium]